MNEFYSKFSRNYFLAVIAFIMGAIAMFSSLMYALVSCKDNDYERFASAFKKARQERKFGNENF